MNVYTYCSFKGSLNGYQFAAFDLDEPVDEVKSLGPEQAENAIPSEVTEWFWMRNGWKLVLVSSEAKANGFLLVRGIERAREFQRSRATNRQAEIEAGNRFRKELKSAESLIADSEFYINLGFEGQMDELRQLAAAFISELRRDGGVRLLELIESTLSKFDLTHYLINLPKFRAILAEIQLVKASPEPLPSPVRYRISFLRKARPKPSMRLDSFADTPRQERNRQLNALIHLLLDKQLFSEKLSLYVFEGSAIPDGVNANLLINLEYLLSVAEG